MLQPAAVDAAGWLSPPSAFAAPGQDGASSCLGAEKIFHFCSELQES